MNLLKRRFSDKAYVTGLILIGISLIIYCLGLLGDKATEKQFTFICNFGITIIYFFIYRNTGNVEAKMHNRFLFLILSLISAFALNRGMQVFEESVNWFSALLILICLNYMAFAWYPIMSSWGKHIVSFANGISMIIFLYLTSYLFPLLPISLPGLLFFGISYHSFVPLLFLVYTFIIQIRVSRRKPYLWLSFGIGSILVVAFCILFVLNWNQATIKINEAWSDKKTDMPHWIETAQKIPHTQLTTEILKGDIVYSRPKFEDMFLLWGPKRRNIGESRKHDPLIYIARGFSSPLIVDEDSRINILEANHDINLKDKAGDNSDEDL